MNSETRLGDKMPSSDNEVNNSFKGPGGPLAPKIANSLSLRRPQAKLP